MIYKKPHYSYRIVKRVLMHSHRFVDERCSMREVSEWSGFSPTTVRLDITERLPHINADLAKEAQIVIGLHKGGKRRATQAKKRQGR